MNDRLKNAIWNIVGKRVNATNSIEMTALREELITAVDQHALSASAIMDMPIHEFESLLNAEGYRPDPSPKTMGDVLRHLPRSMDMGRLIVKIHPPEESK